MCSACLLLACVIRMAGARPPGGAEGGPSQRGAPVPVGFPSPFCCSKSPCPCAFLLVLSLPGVVFAGRSLSAAPPVSYPLMVSFPLLTCGANVPCSK